MTTPKEEKDAVAAFSVHMLRKLRANAHKGHWSYDDIETLAERVQEELDELVEEIKRPRSKRTGTRSAARLKKIIAECADVANMAMMIADNCEEDLRDLGDPT